MRAAAPILLLALAGCMVGPDYRAPPVPGTAGFVAATPVTAGSEPLPEQWWRLYDDPALDALIAPGLCRQHRCAGGDRQSAPRPRRADRSQVAAAADDRYQRRGRHFAAERADKHRAAGFRHRFLPARVRHELRDRPLWPGRPHHRGGARRCRCRGGRARRDAGRRCRRNRPRLCRCLFRARASMRSPNRA